MQRLWLFCPENDIALAQARQRQSFTPPRAGLQVRAAGATLPMWLGAPGDRFLAQGVNNSWFERVSHDFCLDVDLWTPQCGYDYVPTPWGWSHYSRQFFLDAGFPAHLLPTDQQLEGLRALSSRATAVAVNEHLRQMSWPFALPPQPLLVTDIEQLEAPALPQPWLAKALWSSSGRGLLPSTSADFRRQTAGMLNRYGAFTLESRLPRLADFAMLFDYSDGKATYLGVSVFETTDTGNYTANHVAAQPLLLESLTRLVPLVWLQCTQHNVAQGLEQALGTGYRGLLGVDMLIYNGEDGAPLIAPCIEVNLRPTLGHVALNFGNRYLEPGRTAKVALYKYESDVPLEYQACGGRLCAGTVALSPAYPYAFAVTID